MENKKYLTLNDIEAYRVAFHLSNYQKAYDKFSSDFDQLPKLLNQLIKYTNKVLTE